MNRITYPAAAPETRRKADWRDEGLCRSDNENPEDWFPVGGGREAQAAENHAKAVCWQCPSMEACGRWALDNREPVGVWGGMTEGERAKILRRRGIRIH